MTIKFTKMEGAGNDFVVLDNRETKLSLDKLIEITLKLCNRRFGIGADGLMALNSPEIPEVDFTMIYRNADGSDAGMCGNGARCLVYFATLKGFNNSLKFNVHDVIYLAKKEHEKVEISFPIQAKTDEITCRNLPFIQANTGTEHVVHFTSKEELKNEAKLVEIGSSVRYTQKQFPKGTNVNFVALNESSSEIDLQTYERGVENLTLACGTGAIAAAIASHHHSGLTSKENDFKVKVKGGLLEVLFEFDKDNKSYKNIKLRGPAHLVFEGAIEI